MQEQFEVLDGESTRKSQGVLHKQCYSIMIYRMGFQKTFVEIGSPSLGPKLLNKNLCSGLKTKISPHNPMKDKAN